MGPVRMPAVAGQFYPADPQRLRRDVESRLGAPPQGGPLAARAVMVPHAGYIYSGRVAGAVYAAAGLPEALVILCPNHTGAGEPIAVMNRGAWLTPLGEAPIHEALADLILAACPGAVVDAAAHRDEHALEVQLPFLQVARPGFRFVPICVGTDRLEDLLDLGHALASAMDRCGETASAIISSDMSHYISALEARRRDMLALDRVLALDPEGLHRTVRHERISMCGVSPAVAGLAAARERGARAAQLVAYAHSGEVSGDMDHVVGYAGVIAS
jgi:AmmeMemoRadiSam system protein B